MITYDTGTKFGLDNPVIQNVPMWARVYQYPWNTGAIASQKWALGSLPPCRVDYNNLKGASKMNGMGHYSNAFESTMEQLRQIIHMEMQARLAEAEADPNKVALAFNGLQSDILEVKINSPHAFFDAQGREIPNPTPGNEGEWLELITVIVENPLMEGAEERYPQIKALQDHLSSHAGGSGVFGALLMLGLVAGAIGGAVYLYNEYRAPKLTPIVRPLPPPPMAGPPMMGM